MTVAAGRGAEGLEEVGWHPSLQLSVLPSELEASPRLITNTEIAVLLAGTPSAESVTYAARMSAVYNPTLLYFIELFTGNLNKRQ